MIMYPLQLIVSTCMLLTNFKKSFSHATVFDSTRSLLTFKFHSYDICDNLMILQRGYTTFKARCTYYTKRLQWFRSVIYELFSKKSLGSIPSLVQNLANFISTTSPNMRSSLPACCKPKMVCCRICWPESDDRGNNMFISA